ncbi:MAG: nucleotidyl transferase AbiEii/AbiGii toxin family protein [Patescibacteria group bacterium]
MTEEINPGKLLVRVAPILDELKIGYFITGGFAISVWGRPRATFDVDIVVHLVEPKVAPLAKALRKISEFGYIDEDAAREAIDRLGEFNFIDPETGVKVDFWIMKKTPAGRSEFERRIIKKIDGQEVSFISPEDLVLNKLLWYQKSLSSRHLEDAESVLKISGGKLDKKYLKLWAKKLGVADVLTKLLKGNKP